MKSKGTKRRLIKKIKTMASVLQDIVNVNTITWLICSFIGKVMPRNKNRIVVMAPENGSFTDNAKYAYLWLEEVQDYRVTYITYDKDVKDYLKKNGIKIEVYPSAAALFHLLRASVVLGIATVTFRGIKGHLASGAKLVQLWHGAGVKKVHLGNKKYNPNNKTTRKKFQWFVNRTHPMFDLIYFPSKALMEERKHWFRFKEAKINGFVRNDLLLGKNFGSKEDIFTDLEAVDSIRKLKAEGKNLVLYAPTFRKRGLAVFGSQVPFDFQAMDIILKETNSYMVLKLHPWMEEALQFNLYERIIPYEKDKDIYPVLGLFDLLITDYSSIFSDYALLNRPIIHYFPDYNGVVQSQRISQSMIDKLPGPLFNNFNDFIKHFEGVLKGEIPFKQFERNIFHDHTDQLSGPIFIEDIRRLMN